MAAGVILLTIGAGAQPPRPDPHSGLIVGQVLDAASGRPVGGAVVAIGGVPPVRSGNDILVQQRPRILTGSDGRFVFRDLPRGSFSITATKGGFAEGSFGRRRPLGPPSRVALDAGQRIGDVVVPIWKNGSISGMVLDESGEALAAVNVRAFRRVVVSGRRTFVAAGTVSTDDRGIYRFGDLTPGEYVVASSVRHLAQPVALIRRAATTISLQPNPGREFALPGSANSIEVGGVVYGLGLGNPTPPPPENERLSIYPYTFHPAARSFREATPVAVASGQDRSAIDLQLQPVPAIRVSGVVYGPDGAADGQVVRLLPDDPDAMALDLDAPSTATDLSGAFMFGGVPEGRYSLRAVGRQRRPPSPVSPKEPDPLLWADVPVSAGQEDIAGIPVVLQHGLRVHGRFDFQGSAAKPSGPGLTQVAIAVESADGAGSGLVRVDPASGEFSTSGVPAGRYIVKVTASPVGWMFKAAFYGGRDISLTPVDINTGDLWDVVLQFTDRWSGVQGHVTTAKGGLDPGAAVLLFPTDTAGWTSYGRNPRRLRSVRPGSDGGYAIHSVPPGDYYVVAVPDEQSGDWQDPAFLEALTGIASRVSVGEGEKVTRDLRTREVR